MTSISSKFIRTLAVIIFLASQSTVHASSGSEPETGLKLKMSSEVHNIDINHEIKSSVSSGESEAARNHDVSKNKDRSSSHDGGQVVAQEISEKSHNEKIGSGSKAGESSDGSKSVRSSEDMKSSAGNSKKTGSSSEENKSFGGTNKDGESSTGSNKSNGSSEGNKPSSGNNNSNGSGNQASVNSSNQSDGKAPGVSQKPITEPAPTVTPKPAPVTEPTPVIKPKPAPITEPAPTVTPKPAPITELTPVIKPKPAPVTEPAPVIKPKPAPITEPTPFIKPKPAPITEPAPTVTPKPAPVTEPAPVIKPKPAPVTEPTPVIKPKPVPITEPAPSVTPKPSPVTEPAPDVTPAPEPKKDEPKKDEPKKDEPTAPLAPKKEESQKRRLRAKIEPLFFIDFDYGTGIIAIENETPAQKGFAPSLQLTENAPLYQKISYLSLDAGVGAVTKLYFENASGLAAKWFGVIGITKTVGEEISSVRYAKTLKEAEEMDGYRTAPLEVTDIYPWKNGESVTFKSKGGVVFFGVTGFGAAGISMAKVAQGAWETYVEKIDASNVYVKLTNTSLKALAVNGNAGMVGLSVNEFKSADDGFSYKLNLENEVARKVYHDLLRGNVAAAEVLAKQTSAVQKIENFKRVTKSKGLSLFIGVPIFLNASSSENKVEVVNNADLIIDNEKVNSTIGIYDFTIQTRALNAHTLTSKGFYGVRYNVSDLTSTNVKERGEFGRFSWIYQDDHSSGHTVTQMLKNLYDATGLDQLRINLPAEAKDMDFTNVTVDITFDGTKTNDLMNRIAAMTPSGLAEWANQRVHFAYAQEGQNLCLPSQLNAESCEGEILNKTLYGAKKMQEAMIRMRASQSSNSNSDSEYTRAYADFGKAAMTNSITIKMAVAIAGAGVELNFAIEGTYLKNHNVSFRSNENGQFVVDTNAPAVSESALAPKNKRSRYQELGINKVRK